MPPRHAFWTIIYANAPTSFRAATRDELLPTLKQLQSKHPDAVMKWFARGQLWTSPEEAREALFRKRATRPEKRGWPGAKRETHDQIPDREREHRAPAARSGRSAEGRRTGEGHRGREWRPGGGHRDPRDRFKVPRDVRRKRFTARVRRNAAPPKPPRKKKDEE
jgi:hypothetical protein